MFWDEFPLINMVFLVLTFLKFDTIDPFEKYRSATQLFVILASL